MIRIFTDDFQFVTEIDEFESVIWTSRFSSVGDFQIIVNSHSDKSDELQENRIVMLGNKAGIIAHVEDATSESGKGGDRILVKGYDLKGLMIKRLTLTPELNTYDALTANAETIMKRFVKGNAVSTTPERIIPNLSIEPNQSRGPSFFYQTKYKELSVELEKISTASGIGWDVFFDGSGYVFDVLEGKDLTTLQSINPPVIFSVEYDNVREQNMINSTLDYKNVAVVAGQGEGAEREVVIIGDASGLARNEVFIDARDIDEGGNLVDRGMQKLSEYGRIEAFDTRILTDGPFTYREDWNLGDIVTVQNSKKTRTAHVRVSEVVETIEVGGYQLDAVFGQPMPTLIEKIKRELDEPIAEGGGGGGEPGLPGIEGPQGPKGDRGEIGPQGIQGPTGATGEKGDTGDKGDIGLTGPQGDVGPQGPNGDDGPQGVQGPAGDGRSYVVFQREFISAEGQTVFTWADGYEFPLGVNAVSVFVSGNKQPNNSFIENNGHSISLKQGLDSGEYVLIEAMQAVVDVKGPQGIQGIPGVKGDTGAVGPQGEKGDTGTQGPIGLTGLKGDKGDAGLTGATGEKGEIGPQGPIGFVGPQGEKGDTGATGAAGPQGDIQAAITWAQSFGLGNTDLGPLAVHCDNTLVTGFYYASAGSPAGDGALIVISHSAEWKQQQFWEFNGKGQTGNPGRIFHRHMFNGAWQGWYEIGGGGDGGKPYHAGTTPPTNTDLIWIDTN